MWQSDVNVYDKVKNLDTTNKNNFKSVINDLQPTDVAKIDNQINGIFRYKDKKEMIIPRIIFSDSINTMVKDKNLKKSVSFDIHKTDYIGVIL